MIEFSCHCGKHTFSLGEDEAGGVIQCPVCGRLNDVPNLSDIDDLEDDGAYKLGPVIDRIETAEERIARATRAFTRNRRDEHGNDIDMRNTFDDVLASGTDDGAIPLTGELVPEAPKYDPFTGELVAVMDVKPDAIDRDRALAAVAPMAQRVVQYASSDLTKSFSLWRLNWRLLEPVNIFVMAIILVAHGVFEPINIVVHAGMFFAVPLVAAEIIFFLSHYANVIDEIGPSNHDELPRPLRDVSWSEDIWHPFTQFAGAVMVCYWPAIFAFSNDADFLLVLLLLMAGSLVFPALVLTLSTSGTIANARPDRLLSVFRAVGLPYFLIAAVGCGAILLYALGLFRFHIDCMLIFVDGTSASAFRSSRVWWFQAWVTYPALVLAIFGMHWFSAALGLAYREHHERFLWIMQRHVPTKIAERNKPSPTPKNLSANSAKVRAKLQPPPPMPR